MKLSIAVPCYNEEEVLPETSKKLANLLDKLINKDYISPDSLICFIDDGSSDNTWEIIKNLCNEHYCISGLKLSNNCGHQNALFAGLLNVEGDAIISIDADLQDDIYIILEMVEMYQKGFDIVYGVRQEREVDTFFKKISAELYYKVLKLFGVKIIFNHADYRLMSRKALEALSSFSEVNLFLRGLVPLLGFRTTQVYYKRKKRYAGESKYPLLKMLSLAWQGITSFSSVPLKIITAMGFIISSFSFSIGIWALSVKLFNLGTVPGWTSTVVPMYLLGGVNLLSIGVIGEYIGKIYLETKRRPKFIIEEQIYHKKRTINS